MPLAKPPPSHSPGPQEAESPDYLRDQLITCLGNKRALLGFIGQGVARVRARLGGKKISIADLFSGSGVVARSFKRHASSLVANDIEDYCRVINRCYLANASEVKRAELARWHAWLTAELARGLRPGFLTELYAPRDDARITKADRVFYTRRNAMYLDTARQLMDQVPAHLRDYLLAPLLSQASVHANTAGVFKGFYKSREGIGQFGGKGRDALSRILGDIALPLPVFSRFECAVTVCAKDANLLAPSLTGIDLAYLDPPYNQHPYGSNYFMLNLLVTYRRPEKISQVSGIPADWKRSRYNARRQAAETLFSLIADLSAKFLLISYNSEGFIEPREFTARLKRQGRLRVLETPYNAFRGSRNLARRPKHVTETLYLLEKK